MELSIIFVNYKDKAHLLPALRAVFASKVNYDFEVIVVDNDSQDDSLAAVEQEFFGDKNLRDRIQLIPNVNNGFVGGNNLGIKHAKGTYVLLLNCDTEVAPETLQTMMDFMKRHPDVGIATCKLVKANGELDWACRRSFPDPWVSFFRLSGLSKLFPKSKTLAAYNMTYKSVDEETEIDACAGAFMFISPACLKIVQGFDTDYFMYGEDLDMCYRAKQAGFKVWYYPKTTTKHFKGQSSRRAPKRSLYAFHNAMWIFYKKHLYYKYPRPFSWLVYSGIWGRYGLKLMQNSFRKEAIVSK
jgi:GT2 family glycosyltransferase